MRSYHLFLGIAILFFFSCVPADPEYRQKVLENVKDTGFISREFFQILVKVSLPTKDVGILELRKQCRKIAETKRDEMAVSILIKEIRENDSRYGSLQSDPTNNNTNPALPSQISNTTGVSATPGGVAVSGTSANTSNQTFNPYASSTSTSANSSFPDPRAAEREKEKAKLLGQDVLLYRGTFAWFLNSMFLFREDYSDPANCTFIYRNIQKDLYANVIRKGIQPISKQETPEAP
ncbi:hypothetical protein JWG45_11275 [Leptospira sp. 201903070]|uniref:Lipoprotein n=1 Tax=Leptospira ainlahdjerensis TaxID=2810033 RepID=A0ABS2UBF5_9LEPT|nr:hypothetical protein [Leptospira ainlahdjerensis]MBM9577687.1 hypothetical protein [Leptospira ainlahdjerensis]MBM9577733.1 hypothetical protein [Leptospira ainlahdjerensis]